MNGEILATAAATPADAVAAPAHRRRLGRWLGAALLPCALLVLAIALLLLGLLDGAREGLTFVVDGEPWRLASTGGWGIDGGTVAGAALVALLIVTLLVIVLPLVLLATVLSVLLAVGLALLAVAVVLAVGLVALALVLAVGLSPLWCLGLLLWLLLRRRGAVVPAGAAAV